MVFFSNTDIKIALLSASTKTKARKDITEKLKNHEINIIIGTHALISDDIIFAKLGLLVIDEQHRFGVNQRSTILDRAYLRQGFYPHLLVMTATPIPRSLALTLYGDLDLSVIDEKPPGRLKVETKILHGEVMDSLIRLCTRIIETKQKAFIVFPLVNESEHLDLENAQKALTILKNTFGENHTMIVHGKMNQEEKNSSINAFKEGRIKFLVSTTVVEVGVDIPDATCMVVVHPERFGVAQLHQLRGRVGRGNKKSYCFLLCDIKNRFSSGYRRLLALCETDDGFLLAKKDLDIRGAGELLGTKQSGLPNFLVFNYHDFSALLEPAKTYAKGIIEGRIPKDELMHLFNKEKAHFS